MGFWDFKNLVPIIGKGLDLYSTVQDGVMRQSGYESKKRAAIAEAKYTREVARENAQAYLREGAYYGQLKQIEADSLREQTDSTFDFNMFNARNQKREEDKFISQVRASYGASGVAVDTGSAKNVQDYEKYVSNYNLSWNKHFADVQKHQGRKREAVSRFEGQQAKRIASDQARMTEKTARLKSKSLLQGAEFYGDQAGYMDTQTKIGVGKNLFELGQFIKEA